MRQEIAYTLYMLYDKGGTNGAKKFNAARKVQTKKISLCIDLEHR